MSRSRPIRFPLLKLPYLCIEAIIKNSDIFDIIYFALISRRTRRIVKSLNIPLSNIKIFVSIGKQIVLGRESWYIGSMSPQSLVDQFPKLRENPLVIQNNAIPLYTIRTYNALNLYTVGSEKTASKMAMEFLNELFHCSVGYVKFDKGKFEDSLGVKSTINLRIGYQDLQPFSRIQNQQLNSLLENLEVTGTCYFSVMNTETDFYCDPKIFKCKKLVFSRFSARWVTMEILMQFEVPRLKFQQCLCSEEDLVGFVKHWFHSDNWKFEYLYIQCGGRLHNYCSRQVSLEMFQDLNPSPIIKRNRVPSSESFGDIDFSKGLKIRRKDGLEATIHVNRGNFLFYIWHEQ